MGTLQTANVALRSGRYREVAEAIDRVDAKNAAASVVALEAFYYLGRAETVRSEGMRLLGLSALSSAQAATCATIVGWQLSDDGKAEEAIALYRRALDLASENDALTQRCLAASSLLERTCDQRAFDASLPIATITRQAAVGCGDSQVLATVHLSFARLEARAGHVDTAVRHFSLASSLLEAEPNLRLSAALYNDRASLSGASGDIEGALDLIDRAAQLSLESGWAKGVAVSAANRGHLLVALGRMDAAEECLQQAEALQNHHYRLAIAETRARIALRSRKYDLAEKLLSTCEEPGVPLWYGLSAQATRARVYLEQGRWEDALRYANAGFAEATAACAENYALSFAMVRAEALGALRRPLPWDDPLLVSDRRKWPVGVHGAYRAVIASVLHKQTHSARALEHWRQAERIYQASGNHSECAVVSELAQTAQTAGTEVANNLTGGLDLASALFDLAKYPHICAAEVFAAIETAGCAAAVAVVAVGSSGTRVLRSRGWSSAALQTALRAADGVERIELGQDESLSFIIAAKVHEHLDSRVTFASM